MAENRELQILITAKDQASQTMKGLEDKLKTVSKIGAIGFAGLAGVVGLSIKAFQESEVAQARLEQIATQVTGATKEQIDGYKKLAGELQKVGVVEDDVIKAGQSQIASFSKNANTVNILSGSLADLAVAQYGTNVSQDQAIQTGNMLGKALDGQLGALTRAGVLVNDEYTKAFENANNEQERAIILNKIIQDNYGGLNEKMRETSEGGIQALKNSFGDLMEIMGEQFAPMLASLVEKLNPIIEKAGQWINENKELFTKIVLITGAVLGFMAVAYPLIKVIQIATTVFKALQVVALLFNTTLWANPITWVIAGIVALIAIIWVLIANWDTITQAWKVSIEFIMCLFSRMGEWISGVFNKTFTWVSSRIENVKSAFKSLGDFISSLFSSIGEGIKGAFKATINWVIEKINWLIKQANKIQSSLNKVPGVNIPLMSQIPMLANGGIVNKPTLAMIGEAGAEAVVPLNKKNNPLGGGLTIIVNGDVSGQDLIEKVSEAIMGNVRNNTQLAF